MYRIIFSIIKKSTPSEKKDNMTLIRIHSFNRIRSTEQSNKYVYAFLYFLCVSFCCITTKYFQSVVMVVV